jgi:hypothetical protein
MVLTRLPVRFNVGHLVKNIATCQPYFSIIARFSPLTKTQTALVCESEFSASGRLGLAVIIINKADR